MAITLSVPSVVVNNETISIVPNSFTYDGGEGEINVRASSAGGGTVESVHSVNAEGKIGKCKFDVYLTSDMDSRIREWKSQVGQNNIQFSQRLSSGSSSARSFSRMSLINAVERNASSDGVVSLEFSGDPMSGV